MTLTLAFSPCPNDTFIFDALVNKKINNRFTFDVHISDVENLNNNALNNMYDITKISYHAYAFCSREYQVLDAGSALGYGNGPLVVSKRKIYPDELKDARIAIPGKYTTANLLLGIVFPDTINKKEYLFSDIEDVVLSDEVDAGLLIHENRFTYEKRGLKLILDLGKWWEQNINEPIPLGAIVIKRSLPDEVKNSVNDLIKNSLNVAYTNPDGTRNYIGQYAASLDEKVIKQHIDLYVNDFTLELGEKGKNAINVLYKKAGEAGVIPTVPADIFLTD